MKGGGMAEEGKPWKSGGLMEPFGFEVGLSALAQPRLTKGGQPYRPPQGGRG